MIIFYCNKFLLILQAYSGGASGEGAVGKYRFLASQS